MYLIQTSESDVYKRQILTFKLGPRMLFLYLYFIINSILYYNKMTYYYVIDVCYAYITFLNIYFVQIYNINNCVFHLNNEVEAKLKKMIKEDHWMNDGDPQYHMQ